MFQVIDSGLVISKVITGGVCIAAFASSVGLPVSIVLSGDSLLFSLEKLITQKSFELFTIKQEEKQCKEATYQKHIR